MCSDLNTLVFLTICVLSADYILCHSFLVKFLFLYLKSHPQTLVFTIQLRSCSVFAYSVHFLFFRFTISTHRRVHLIDLKTGFLEYNGHLQLTMQHGWCRDIITIDSSVIIYFSRLWQSTGTFYFANSKFVLRRLSYAS